jgi:hypothetical protein
MAADNMTDSQHVPASANIARRSFSIFSRKGYDTPSPVVQSLAVGSVALATPSAPTSIPTRTTSLQPSQSMIQKSKKWKLRRPADPKSSPGTIIRLVPKESTPPPMTPLEIEMATAPNEEILRNIGLSPEESPLPRVEPIYFPPVPTKTSRMSTKRMSMSRRESKSQNNIVGRWKNGAVAWESEVLSVRKSSSPERPKTSDGLPDNETKAEPPKLQVVIPASSYKMFQAIPYLSNSAINVPTYDILNGTHEVSPPSVSTTGAESFQVSALDLQSGSYDANLQRTYSYNANKFHDQTQPKPEKTLQVPITQEAASSSSSTTGSISGDDENTSEVSSYRSSLTSLDSLSGISHDYETEKRYSPEPVLSPKQEMRDPLTDQVTPQSPGLSDLIHLVRTPSTTQRTHRRNRSLSSGPVTTLRTLPEANEEQAEPSPTLSEAEIEFEHSLSQLSTAPSRKRSISREPSLARKPVVPPRSEKRLSIRRDARRVVSEPVPLVIPMLVEPESPKETFLVRSSSVRSTLSLILEEDDGRQISSEDAEVVIFHILENTDSLDDLLNMALINRGFYRVFKRHELDLMQKVLRAQSPAAWEFRMTSMPCADESDDEVSTMPTPEFTAATFYDNFLRDAHIMAGIKHLILERCQSILRPDTVRSLRAPHVPHASSRVDDALYRIWTFCLLFGSDLGREDDIATQMDWLRGGIEAHQVCAESSFSSSGSLFMNSTLLICSEHFGRGNEGGLTAEQLYDMTELWNCLRTISQGIIGRTEQARQFGVFDCTDVRGGDIDGEEMMLGKSSFPHNSVITPANALSRGMAQLSLDSWSPHYLRYLLNHKPASGLYSCPPSSLDHLATSTPRILAFSLPPRMRLPPLRRAHLRSLLTHSNGIRFPAGSTPQAWLQLGHRAEEAQGEHATRCAICGERSHDEPREYGRRTTQRHSSRPAAAPSTATRPFAAPSLQGRRTCPTRQRGRSNTAKESASASHEPHRRAWAKA